LINNCTSSSHHQGSQQNKKQASWNRLSALSAADTIHSNNEIELRMKASDSMDGFREMPIDCMPFSYDTSTMNLMVGTQHSNDPTISNSKINDSTNGENNVIMRNDSRIMKLFLVNDSNLDENDTNNNSDEIVLINNNLYTKSNEKNSINNTLMLINESDQNKPNSSNYNNNLKSFTNMINANNLQSLLNRRSTLYRNSSLSTISEEKTLATLTDVSIKNNKQLNSSYDASRAALAFKNYNAKTIIESLLDDFQEKTVLLNEMIKVFEPSSKHGNFNRNVPIRFSSPLKLNSRLTNGHVNTNTKSNISLNQTSTSPSNKKMVTYSPIISVNNKQMYENDYNFDIFGSNSSNLILFDMNHYNNEYEDDVNETNKSSCSDFSRSSTGVNRLNQKKLRFVKRLKNRIETKSGRNMALQQKSEDQTQNNNDLSSNNNDLTLKKRLSFDIIDNDINIFTRENVLETSSNNSLSMLETNNNPFEQNNLVSNNNNEIIVRPNLIVNNNIEPVFF
jgi:hypothetical protein